MTGLRASSIRWNRPNQHQANIDSADEIHRSEIVLSQSARKLLQKVPRGCWGGGEEVEDSTLL